MKHYIVAVKTMDFGIQIYTFKSEEKRKNFIDELKSEQSNLQFGKLEFATSELEE